MEITILRVSYRRHDKETEAKWIDETKRAVAHIAIEIHTATKKAERVFSYEPIECGGIVSCTVVIEPRAVILAPGVLERIRRSAGNRCLAESLVAVACGHSSGGVAQRQG